VNEETSNSPESPRQPDGLEAMCAGIMRTRFGRKPSGAVTRAMLQLQAEEAAGRRKNSSAAGSWRERIQNWVSRLQPRSRFALGAACMLVTVLAVWFLQSEGLINLASPRSRWICKVSGSLDMRWAAKSPKPKIGDVLGSDLLRLESGVVELTFSTGAKVAIEGPAQFKVNGVNGLELLAGKISAEVSGKSHGFSVKSPTASVVDLGTRFGEIVNAEHATEVDVFQGKVTVSPVSGNSGNRWQLTQGKALLVDAQSAVTANALPEGAFPQPEISVLARPQNCGFDVSARAVQGDVPTDFGYWSGPTFLITGPVQNIRPVEGAGMLQFLNPTSGSSGSSEVWQIIDLRPFRKFLSSGFVEGRLTSMFNHIRCDANVAGKFGLSLAAYHGLPGELSSPWDQRESLALAVADKELVADNDPVTWEKVEISAKLPAETDFVIIQIRAMVSGTSAAAVKLPGHFADLVDFKLCTPMRRSSISTGR
jgi:FecR protein